MGLDMYLSKKIYIGANYEHNHVKGTIKLTKGEGKNKKPVKIDLSKVSYIIEEAAYWRKANQIHKWFVDNVQNGEDNCGGYYVSKKQLQELVDICKKVKASVKTVDGQVNNGYSLTEEGKEYHYDPGTVIVNQEEIEQLLPTQEGFFFGGTDYDQYYMEDIENTIKQLEPLLSEDQEGDFEYSSSW